MGEPDYRVYRHFDGQGNLLYVGLSKQVLKRLNAHSYNSEWFDQVRMISIEKFADYDDAMAAERVAIMAESPRYNKLRVLKHPDCGCRKLIDWNNASKMSHDDLAELLGVKPSKLKNWKNGQIPDENVRRDIEALTCGKVPADVGWL